MRTSDPFGRARRGCRLVRAIYIFNTCIVSYFVLIYKDIYLKIAEMSYYYLYRLREHRERRGLTQEELALLSGVSRPSIAALELGYRSAYPKTAEKLARALKVKPAELWERRNGGER